MVWKNADGVTVRFGLEECVSESRPRDIPADGNQREVVVPLRWNDLTGYDSDKNNDGTLDSFSGLNACIPAGASIDSARIVVDKAFTKAATADISMNIGLDTKLGVAIDRDGIDAALVVANLEAGDVVVCDGALVGKTIGADDGYILVKNDGSGVLTAGEGSLVIKYTPKSTR